MSLGVHFVHVLVCCTHSVGVGGCGWVCGCLVQCGCTHCYMEGRLVVVRQLILRKDD